jgi:hypothetical protein
LVQKPPTAEQRLMGRTFRPAEVPEQVEAAAVRKPENLHRKARQELNQSE